MTAISFLWKNIMIEKADQNLNYRSDIKTYLAMIITDLSNIQTLFKSGINIELLFKVHLLESNSPTRVT